MFEEEDHEPYFLAARSIMPGDEVCYAGEVVKIFRFDDEIVIVFENGVNWQIPPHETVELDDVIVTPMDSQLDFFLSDVYPVDELPIDPLKEVR